MMHSDQIIRGESVMSRVAWFRLANWCAFGFLFALPIASFAQQRQVEEIIVSVRKMDENVQDIPIQVTVFGEQDIERERIRSLKDVAELTPSVQFDTGFWPSDTRVSIRGLFNRAGRPSAAVLVDGIDAMSESLESAGGSALLNQRILDLERIEVARGPQSALYGRGAFAGAINYVTRRPPKEWSGSVMADAAEDSRYELQGMFGGPIIEDKLTFNAMLSDYSLDGYYTNPNTGDDVGGGDSKGGSLGFEWTPTDNVSVYWNNTYSDDEYDPQAVAAIKANAFRVAQNDGNDNITLIQNGNPDTETGDCLNPGSAPGRDACLWVVQGKVKAQERDINLSPDPRTGGEYSGTDDETYRSSLIVDWDISDNYSLRSASSYTDSDQAVSMDTTYTFGLPPEEDYFNQTGNAADARYTFNFDQYYQEFQLSYDADGRFNWLAGVNAFLEDASNKNTSRFWYRDPALCNSSSAACSFEDAERFNKTIDRDTYSYSGFGLIGIELADSLKLTLEGRLIYDKIKVSANTSDSASASLGFPFFTYAGSPGFRDDIDDTNFVPRASLDWFAAEGVMFYGSVAKGIKPPTYNTTDITDPEIARVRKEKLWTYELGSKTSWSEGRVILNGAVFYNDYKDQQVLVQFEGDFLPRSGTANAGSVDVYGLELDLTWQPTDNILLNASYAYTDGEYDDFVLADAQNSGVPVSGSNQAKAASKDGDFSGNDTAGVPQNALAFLGRYQHEFINDFDWYVQATAQYQDERWADVANLVTLESYWKANGQVGIENENWFASIYVENMFDDDTITYAQEFIDQQQGFQLQSTATFPVAYFAYLPQPRTVGVKVIYKTR
jgi:iron complex outermembrane receptor protein